MFGGPTFGGAVGSAWEDREIVLGGGVFWFRESGRWKKFSFRVGKPEILQQAEVLVGYVDIGGG
jgi:hypothetical protein